MWIEYNANPIKRAGDCGVRAVSKALDLSWEDAYTRLCITGMELCDMPSNNGVIGLLLKRNNFRRGYLSDIRPEYTISQFCEEHPKGTYVVFVGNHVLCIKDGCYYDSWDSGNEIVIFYFEKGDN